MRKPVRCDKCKYYKEDDIYKGEGECQHPKTTSPYTRDHRVCDLLPTNEDRKQALK